MHISQATWMVHTLGSKESRPSGAHHVSAPTTKNTHTHKNNGGSTSQTEHIQNEKQGFAEYLNLHEVVVVCF